MSKTAVPAFGNLKFAKVVNSSKRENNTLIVIASTPTRDVNPKLKAYHWHAEPESYFDLFDAIEAELDYAEQRGYSAVICASDKAIAFALSRLQQISNENDTRSLSEILGDHPELAAALPRNFCLELAIFWGWKRDIPYYLDIIKCCWKSNGFCLSKLLNFKFKELIELEEKTGLLKPE